MRTSVFTHYLAGRWILSACLVGAALYGISCVQAVAEMSLVVQAREGGDVEGPLSYQPAKPLPADQTFHLVAEDSEPQEPLVAQTDAQGVLWWWSSAARLVTYKLQPGQDANRVVLTKDGSEAIKVTIDGKLFTVFHFKKSEPRVYLYPVIGPTGVGVTRDYVMKDNSVEKENKRQDHPHHRSLWTGYGDIRVSELDKPGYDFWAEPKDKPQAKQVVTKIDRMVSGPVFGQIKARIEWLSPEGKRLFSEQRTYTFYVGHADARVIDQVNVFSFDDMDVTFADTKEGGIISTRVAVTMDEKGVTTPKPLRGQMTNSKGGVGAEACWGKRAEWCDYVGPVDGQTVGVAIFDHPANFRHPTGWHIRDYGLYTANPFAQKGFMQKEDGSHTFKKGESTEFKYRVVIHKDDAKTARIAKQWKLYSDPPKTDLK